MKPHKTIHETERSDKAKRIYEAPHKQLRVNKTQNEEN